MHIDDIQRLIDVPAEKRDALWKEKFYELIQIVSLTVQEDFLGPDGFLYTRTKIQSPNSREGIFIKDLIDTCLIEGKGIACFNENGNLIWVFSYGALRSLKERGNFETFENDDASNSDRVEKLPISNMPTAVERRTVTEERKVFVGQPSESFFPKYARKVVRDYLEVHGIAEPRLVLFMDPSLSPSQSLLFSIFPEDFSDEQRFRTFMERLSWFFPNPYGLLAMSKESTKNYPFEPL